MSVTQAFKEMITKRLGLELPNEVWDIHPVGYRMLIAPNRVSDRSRGGIYFPNSAIERQKLEMGAGVVIAVGPLVGTDPHLGPAGSMSLVAPEDALGMSVIYRAFAGVNIKTTQEDDEFVGGRYELIILTDRDILAWSRE